MPFIKNSLWLLICSLIFFSSCTNNSRKPVYFSTIEPKNGINQYEAILIADKKTEDADFRNYFQAIQPIIRTDKHAMKYPDYWFVDYTPEVWMDFTSFLVVIHKKTGEVIRARDYYWPEKRPGLDWVFE